MSPIKHYYRKCPFEFQKGEDVTDVLYKGHEGDFRIKIQTITFMLLSDALLLLSSWYYTLDIARVLDRNKGKKKQIWPKVKIFCFLGFKALLGNSKICLQ